METIHRQKDTPIKLVYLIGTYPELTNTFIDREIAALRRQGNFQIQIVSIRSPHTHASFSPEQRALHHETRYLVPEKWSAFNFFAFILANGFFIFTRPLVYFGTLVDLLTNAQPGFKSWMKLFLYFLQGVYAAYLLRLNDFDHIHVHFMDRAVLVALVVSRFLGKTYSFTAHAADIYTHAVLVRQKIDNADFMITVSQYNKQHLLNAYPGIDAPKIHILHPWVDVDRFTPHENRSVHDHLHILSVGRLVEKKGHIDLIDALKRLHEAGIDAECRIVGDGPLYTQLYERILSHGLQDRVHLVGSLPQEQVMANLRDWADIFVLPCVIAANGDRDGIPVSIAEAMAVELPVISTDIVGIRELVQPGTGILVPPHDPAALAGALRQMASLDPSGLVEMGRKGREVVDRDFNLPKGTLELAGYFSEAVGKRYVVKMEKDRHVSSSSFGTR